MRKLTQEEFVTAVAVHLRDHEYLSATEAGENDFPTSVVVHAHYPELLERATDEDRDSARAALEWARSWDTEPDVDASERDADFRQRLADVVRSGKVNRRSTGFLASLITCQARDLAKRIERTEAATSSSEHVGRLDERIRGVTLFVVKRWTFSGRFGEKNVHTFEDENGNVLTWWASNGTELDVGRRYVVDFTIKNHGEFRGVRETTLTRVKVVRAVEVRTTEVTR